MTEENPKSVPAEDVRQASAEMLQKQLYVIHTLPVDGMGPVFANLEDHLAFQVGLERDGVMFAAGPLWTGDEQSWEGEGMVVIRAASMAEARSIAERDPMHARGARRFTVRPWMINEGSVTLRLDYSSQSFTIT